jgi:hypothetical protein
MYDVPKFLKRDKDSLLFNGEGELIFYVPELYFEREFAIIVGEYVNLIGVLDYAIFDKNGKHSGLKQFRFPTIFLTKPSKIEKIKSIKLTEKSEIQNYRALKFTEGDQVIVSVKVPKLIDNVEEFYNIFLTGNLPTTIPYNILHEYFIDSIRLNGANYGVNIQLFGLIISETCRDPKDPNKPFRLSSSKTDMTSYRNISIKDIPNLISPYTAITSENWDESVVNAIINKNAKSTPLEKLLTI